MQMQVAWALTTLGLIELPEARFILGQQATRLQNDGLCRTACQIVSDLRAKHHWSADEFDDVSVPTLGLDEMGCSFFDYGPRTIKMVVHGREELLLIDQSTGKQYEKLPPARKKDDREKYAFARQEYKFIRKPLLEVVAS